MIRKQLRTYSETVPEGIIILRGSWKLVAPQSHSPYTTILNYNDSILIIRPWRRKDPTKHARHRQRESEREWGIGRWTWSSYSQSRMPFVVFMSGLLITTLHGFGAVGIGTGYQYLIQSMVLQPLGQYATIIQYRPRSPRTATE